MDKLEACATVHYCLDGNCTAAVATKMVDFLGCFANDKGAAKSVDTAQGCAADAKLDFGPIKSCYDDGAAKEQAYRTVIAAAKAAGPFFAEMKCVPWVVVGGDVFSDPTQMSCVPHDDSRSLIKAVCDRYTGPKPGGCRAPPPTPTPPPPPTPAPGNWTKAGGANCYGARGAGTSSHGATDLEDPPDSSCGTMTLAQCLVKCDGLAGCTAVTVQDDDSGGGGGGLVKCFRKGDVSLQHCDQGSGYTTYVRGSAALVAQTNCYGARGGNPAHGAKDMESPADASCGTMSVGDCLAKCAAQPGCTAVNWERTGGDAGNCYRKADIALEHCDSHAPFDLWLSKD